MKRNPVFQKTSLVVCSFLCLLTACAEKEIAPPTEKTLLEKATYRDLEGWGEDQQKQAIEALRKSCSVFEKKERTHQFRVEQAGTVQDWMPACEELRMTSFESDQQARAFFEKYFTPYRVSNSNEGLFTGYYEAQLNGALEKKAPYLTPLWSKPNDLLTVDLGAFRDSWKGQKITGKIRDSSFIPYDDRALVSKGSLIGRAKPLVWVDDPVAAFFLEVQGSGQVLLADGKVVRVGYDAQNGHGYTPIGRVLADRGEIEKPVTMQKIRKWLKDHPERAQEIMNTNPSVVFFRKTDKDGAVGAQGVTLTPMRSLAVDPAFVPLGVPVWLSTTEHRRLVVAQDTGGAIKGAVRGDLFWGAGQRAEEGAGQMQNTGKYYLLLPKKGEEPNG